VIIPAIDRGKATEHWTLPSSLDILFNKSIFAFKMAAQQSYYELYRGSRYGDHQNSMKRVTWGLTVT
jgi:hypothetical protein